MPTGVEVLLVPLAVTVVPGCGCCCAALAIPGPGSCTHAPPAGSTRWGLGSTTGFAWRTNLGVLVVRAAGLAAVGFMMGALLPVVDEHPRGRPGLRRPSSPPSTSVEDVVLGFVAMISTIVGLVLAVYAAFRMGATRTEEASTRAEFYDEIAPRCAARRTCADPRRGARSAGRDASTTLLPGALATDARDGRGCVLGDGQQHAPGRRGVRRAGRARVRGCSRG